MFGFTLGILCAIQHHSRSHATSMLHVFYFFPEKSWMNLLRAVAKHWKIVNQPFEEQKLSLILLELTFNMCNNTIKKSTRPSHGCYVAIRAQTNNRCIKQIYGSVTNNSIQRHGKRTIYFKCPIDMLMLLHRTSYISNNDSVMDPSTFVQIEMEEERNKKTGFETGFLFIVTDITMSVPGIREKRRETGIVIIAVLDLIRAMCILCASPQYLHRDDPVGHNQTLTNSSVQWVEWIFGESAYRVIGLADDALESPAHDDDYDAWPLLCVAGGGKRRGCWANIFDCWPPFCEGFISKFEFLIADSSCSVAATFSSKTPLSVNVDSIFEGFCWNEFIAASPVLSFEAANSVSIVVNRARMSASCILASAACRLDISIRFFNASFSYLDRRNSTILDGRSVSRHLLHLQVALQYSIWSADKSLEMLVHCVWYCFPHWVILTPCLIGHILFPHSWHGELPCRVGECGGII